MKIAHTGLKLTTGKFKYQDEVYDALVAKFQPVKLSPQVFELLGEDFEAAQAIALPASKALDLLILDIEKVENRLERSVEPAEQETLRKCLAQLEAQQPLCDLALSEAEAVMVRAMGLFSLKPTVLVGDAATAADVCRAVIEKAGMMFFYTVGKPEVHAWLVEANASAVVCAGRIHSDLARGFIKAEIFRLEDVLAAHSVQDARSKGLLKLVDREFPVPPNSILEIRFNV